MSRSFDVGTIDGLVLALLGLLAIHMKRYGYRVGPASGPPREVTPIVVFPPGALPLLAFLAIAALSIFGSRMPLYGLMDLVKLVRGLLIFWVTVNLVRDDRIGAALPGYVALFVLVETAVVASQYLRGFWWSPGTFTHKNSLAMAMNMLMPLIFITGLTGRFSGPLSERTLWRRMRMPVYLVLYCGGVISLILSRSRMGWATMVLAALLVVAGAIAFGAIWRDRNLIRAQILALSFMFLVALPLLVVAADGILSRIGEDREVTMSFREHNNAVARTLAAEHVLGVGLNNYVLELWEPVGDALPDFDKTVAHHMYNLVAAETGYVGLTVWVVCLLNIVFIGVYTVTAGRKRFARVGSFGLLVGLVTALLHSFMESDLLRRETYFIFCMLAGMLVGLHMREGLRGLPGFAGSVGRVLRAARAEP
jgi:hypothetical protein